MPTEPVFKFDETKVKEKFALIEVEVNKQQGKKGHNPFIWLQNVVNPLVNRFLNKDERTKELYDAIVALPTTPPIPKMTTDNAPTTMDIRQGLPNSGLGGLKLPEHNN